MPVKTFDCLACNLPVLAKAAENGKQVSVLVELKARFDEESNIGWAKTLEKAGCHVVYGVIGFKTHAKILLIVRNEDDGIRRYVHLGTGNYNDKTAKLYTDAGLFTCRSDYGADASDLFNMITGYSQPGNWRKLIVAPLTLRSRIIELIQNEIDKSSPDNQGLIIAKMNSLVDKEIIKMLYHASSIHVKVHLIVRGICCLKPGVKGLSENITVHSIVGDTWNIREPFISEIAVIRFISWPVQIGCPEILTDASRLCFRWKM
jgi:polyphosphate kinase